MQKKEDILQQLVDMSLWLGNESRGLAARGEGNTSARISDDTFFVKATGSRLDIVSAENIVEVNASSVLDMFDHPELTDAEIKARLSAARVNGDASPMPSIETLFHAYLLSLPGVNFVGHTHPISVNGILCSNGWKEITQNRIFPYELVYCGAVPAHVEYADPGVSLARKVRESVESYMEAHGVAPKALLMQNHGMIAVGSTTDEVLSITEMWDKAARILTATFLFGGPHYMTDAQIKHLGF